MTPNEAREAILSPFRLIDSAGDYAGLATWHQVGESLAASPEGWIAIPGRADCYVEGSETELRTAWEAWCAE